MTNSMYLIVGFSLGSLAFSVFDLLRTWNIKRDFQGPNDVEVYLRPRIAGIANVFVVNIFYWGFLYQDLEIVWISSDSITFDLLFVALSVLALRTGYRWNREAIVLDLNSITYISISSTVTLDLSRICEVRADRHDIQISSFSHPLERSHSGRMRISTPWARFSRLAAKLQEVERQNCITRLKSLEDETNFLRLERVLKVARRRGLKFDASRYARKG